MHYYSILLLFILSRVFFFFLSFSSIKYSKMALLITYIYHIISNQLHIIMYIRYIIYIYIMYTKFIYIIIFFFTGREGCICIYIMLNNGYSHSQIIGQINKLTKFKILYNFIFSKFVNLFSLFLPRQSYNLSRTHPTSSILHTVTGN